MRCVSAAFAIVGLVVLFQPLTGLSAAPLDLDTIAPDEPPEQLCDRLAANPFAGFGADEWDYNKGAYGVGLNPEEAKELIARAADLDDPSAMAILASLVEGAQAARPSRNKRTWTFTPRQSVSSKLDGPAG